MIHETIFTRTVAFNPGPDLKVPSEFYPLFHATKVRHGNNHIHFPVTSTRMNTLMGKFVKRFKSIKWHADFAGIETYDDPSYQVEQKHKTS